MIDVAAFGIVFGVPSIFTIGIVFASLAVLCAVVVLIDGIAQERLVTAFLGIPAGVLADVYGVANSMAADDGSHDRALKSGATPC